MSYYANKDEYRGVVMRNNGEGIPLAAEFLASGGTLVLVTHVGKNANTPGSVT